MRCTIRLAMLAAVSATLAACASPTAPAPLACQNAKIPYARCTNNDYVNPMGDYVNPMGDYVNPMGNKVSGTD